jgi:hypothetical protein
MKTIKTLYCGAEMLCFALNAVCYFEAPYVVEGETSALNVWKRSGHGLRN